MKVKADTFLKSLKCDGGGSMWGGEYVGGGGLRPAESRRHSMASSPSGSLGTLEMSREKLVPQEPVGPEN